MQSIRRSVKLSAEYVCKEIAISTTTLSRYENGKRQPKAETLKKMAQLYNTTVDELLR